MNNPWRAAIYAMLVLAGFFLAIVSLGPALDVTAGNFPKRFLIDDLPVCDDSPSRDGRFYSVLDPLDEADCVVGDGTDPPHLCGCNGATSTYFSPSAPVPFDGMRVARNAVQPISDGVNTTIIWDVVVLDPQGAPIDDAGWSDIGGANPTRVTFDVRGRALCGAVVIAQNQPIQTNQIGIRGLINGVPVDPDFLNFSVAVDEGDAASFEHLFAFDALDFIEVEVIQNTGSDLDIRAGFFCQRTR
jgi:hypothetical protein